MTSGDIFIQIKSMVWGGHDPPPPEFTPDTYKNMVSDSLTILNFTIIGK